MSGKPRWWRFGGPGQQPVTAAMIRGEYFISMDLAWPAVVWRGGRCWSYLRDLAPAALQRIMQRCRETELQRSDPFPLSRSPRGMPIN